MFNYFSECPTFRRYYGQKILCSEGLMFRGYTCLEGSMFRRSYVQKVLCSEGPKFSSSYVQKSHKQRRSTYGAKTQCKKERFLGKLRCKSTTLTAQLGSYCCLPLLVSVKIQSFRKMKALFIGHKIDY